MRQVSVTQSEAAINTGPKDRRLFDRVGSETNAPRTSCAGRQAAHHRKVLATVCGVFLLAFLLYELPDGRVAVRGLPAFPLPQTCASRIWLGIRCPGCGLTRSIIHLAEGDWQASWHDHRLGGLLALVIVSQVPVRLYSLRRPDRPVFSTRWQIAMGYALFAALVANWVVDVAAGRISSP